MSLALNSLCTMGNLDPERQLPNGHTGSVQAQYGARMAHLYGINKLCKIRFQEFIGATCQAPSYFDFEVVYFSLMEA